MKKIVIAFGLIIFICTLVVILFTNKNSNVFISNSFAKNKRNIPKPINTWIKNIDSIPLPDGFERIALPNNSFGFYLQHLSLKKDKTVYLFNGKKNEISKPNLQ